MCWTGLDAWIPNVLPDLRQVRLSTVFHDGSVRFRRQAHRTVSDVEIPEDSFLASHLILTHRAGHALAGVALLSGDLERATGGSGDDPSRREHGSAAGVVT